MRKLNSKNKAFIAVFSLIVIAMIVILVVAVFQSQKNGKTVYNISNNSVLYDNDTNLVDTSDGGMISKKWDGQYYYNDVNDIEYKLGTQTVVYEKSTKEVNIFGDNYQILKDGSVIQNEDMTKINDLSKTSFYKIADRIYLIIAPEIYNEDKSVYTSKYMVVYIDKKGNASFINDVLNLKTINPMTLIFEEYTFDIANEKLIFDEKTIDLKSINGSTNEYKPKEKKEEVDVPLKDLAEQYNSLVNSFQQYVDATEPLIGANQQIGDVNNVIMNGSNNNNSEGNDEEETQEAINLTNITKKVSLRGSVSSSNHIDVSYSVSDVADQFQAVYLLVTGEIDGEKRTDKIILDKYQTKYRLTELSPRSEYTIVLGYIEKTETMTGEKVLQDSTEDVINVRTTKVNASIVIDKISKGYVYFTFKMSDDFVLESGKIALFDSDEKVEGAEVEIDMSEAITNKGFSDRITLIEAEKLELRLIDAVYDEKVIELNVKNKFTY